MFTCKSSGIFEGIPKFNCFKTIQKLTSCDENHETLMNGRTESENQNDYLTLLIVLMCTKSMPQTDDY